MVRLHQRTPENRVRSKPSLTYRGFDVDWHPDSWEFSYVPARGAARVYLGAQASVRAAIDQQLERASGRQPSRRAGASPILIDVAVGVLACQRPERTISAIDAAAELDDMGLLRDYPPRRGRPLRHLLRAGRITNASREAGRWIIACDEGIRRAIVAGGGVSKPREDPWEELVSSLDELSNATRRVARQTAERGAASASAQGWASRGRRRVDQAVVRLGGPAEVGRLALERRSLPPDGSRDSEDWSPAEDAAIVADYLEMLEAERAGQPYNKSAHRRALLPKLDGRSEAAIEFKHRNISASMERLGLPAIKGYVPATNIQGALIDEITRQTRGGQTIQEAEASAPVPDTIGLATFVEPPPRSGVKGGKKGAVMPRMPDYGALQEENRKLGRTGEDLVVDLERVRLRGEGHPELAEKVRNIARDLGDGPGYDVQSFEVDGSPRYIEVKTTRGGAGTAFYLSDWEFRFAEDHPDSAYLYRVYELGHAPKVYVVRPPYGSELTLEPITYRARR